ncbi:MAG: hypothetical protein ACXVLT_05375 [Flavisolibacter sp.]
MQKTILFFSITLISFFSYGQAQEGKVDYQKTSQPAAVIELPYSVSTVDAAMNNYLSRKGKSRGETVKGFSTFRNTEPVQGDSVNADLYFKTERKSRKEKEVTVISLLVQPSEGQVNAANAHYMHMDEAEKYLNDLANAIDAYELELSIKEQNDAVIKAENKYKSLVNDGQDFENKRAAIDKKIADNKDDQLRQLKEIEKQKQKLSERISQRKS